VDQVAAHAVRHLAFVLRTDPVVADELVGEPGLVRAILAHPMAMAGHPVSGLTP
jgi:hypothetical protein